MGELINARASLGQKVPSTLAAVTLPYPGYKMMLEKSVLARVRFTDEAPSRGDDQDSDRIVHLAWDDIDILKARGPVAKQCGSAYLRCARYYEDQMG